MNKPPLNYKSASIGVSGPEQYENQSWNAYIEYLQGLIKSIENKGGIEITIGHEVMWGDYCPSDYYANFFVPMTESEIETKKRANIKRKEAAKRRESLKLEKERKEFERLKKKFEN